MEHFDFKINIIYLLLVQNMEFMNLIVDWIKLQCLGDMMNICTEF